VTESPTEEESSAEEAPPARPDELQFRASVILADTAQIDPLGKVGILGAGWHVTSGQPAPGGGLQIAAQTVVVIVEVPATRTAEHFPIVVEMVDQDGRLVTAVQPNGPDLPLRFEQMVRAEPTMFAPRAFHSMTRLVLNFAVGMILPTDGIYRWRATIDGSSNEAWSAGFAVIPLGGPVPPNASQGRFIGPN